MGSRFVGRMDEGGRWEEVGRSAGGIRIVVGKSEKTLKSYQSNQKNDDLIFRPHSKRS